jgi:hypothetical protein
MALALTHPSAVAQSSAAAQPAAPLKEIHVDMTCKILPDESDALSGISQEELQNDHAICHLESVFNSHHIEEALKDGAMLRSNVSVKEQEYLLQNVTSERIAFVVEHDVPEEWKIDSDPAPIKVVDNKAYFRVYAEPGQIVRLHVGARHADPIPDGD